MATDIKDRAFGLSYDRVFAQTFSFFSLIEYEDFFTNPFIILFQTQRHMLQRLWHVTVVLYGAISILAGNHAFMFW